MANGSFALTRLRLRHYRSIAGCDVDLGALNFLVGPNGAGKSNVLDALRLTSQALNENLDNALRDRGGVAEVRRRSAGHPTHFGIEINFSFAGGYGEYKFQIGATKGGGFAVTHEECSLKSLELSTSDAYFKVRDGEVIAGSEILPKLTSDRLALAAVSGFDAFRPAFDGLAAIVIYNLNPDAMRTLNRSDPVRLLRRDGANIASVLARLKREQPEAKAEIERYLGRIVEGVRKVERKGLDAYETIEVWQQVGKSKDPWKFAATSMSDGTLRALGVLVALFDASGDSSAPIGIEEPEVALHPAAAGLLLDALRDAAAHRQVLVTSHSPDLLDNRSITESEVIAVRSIDGATVVGKLDAVGARALRESLFTPGEMLRNDRLVPSKRAADVQGKLFA